MSLERYRAMAQPFSAHRSLSRRRRFVAGMIWGLAFVLTLPMMVMIRFRVSKPTATGSVKRICFPTWISEAFKAYITALFFTGVFIPGLVIVGLYFGLSRQYWVTQGSLKGSSRSFRCRALKQKVISMIFSIVVAYWTCVLPFWGCQLAKLFSPESLKALSPARIALEETKKEYLAQKSQSRGSSRVDWVSCNNATAGTWVDEEIIP